MTKQNNSIKNTGDNQIETKPQKIGNSFYRHSTFWTAFIAVIIILCMIGAFYLYRYEIVTQYTTIIKNTKSDHNELLTKTKKSLTEAQKQNAILNKELAHEKEVYKATLQKVHALQKKYLERIQALEFQVKHKTQLERTALPTD
ncbi:MAG TPA: hypothetical protein QF753_11890 [Victivallales bacterium]|nr:hypothetical protein [Victivallales bacterium]